MGSPGDRALARLHGAAVRTATARLVGPVTWTVLPGQRWVVLGPNGAGKSTLLRLVGGWEFPSAGRVAILGERVGETDLRDIRARVGWTAGLLDRTLAPGSTVLDVVLTGLRGHLRRWRQEVGPDEERRARDLLALVRCEHLGGRRYDTLSEGERMRVLVGRALMADPALLLLDEPFAGLDLAGRELLVATLDDVAAREPQRAVVLVTHHLEDVPGSSTHGLLLRDGTVEAQGALPDVLTDAAVSRCFGLPVRVRREDGRYATLARRPPGPLEAAPGSDARGA